MANESDIIAAVRAGNAAHVAELVAESPQLVHARADSGESAVLLAAYYGHRAIVDFLIDRGAALSFFEAAATGRLERVEALLLADPALLNAFSPDGFTALGLAAFFGYGELVDLLLARGAAVNVASHNPLKVMPLHSAVAARHLGISRALVVHGAEVDATQQDDFTPLHEAAQNGDLDMIDFLLAHGAGASITARVSSGGTPYDIAIKAGKAEAAERIKTYGK